jgi:hypothetical protein
MQAGSGGVNRRPLAIELVALVAISFLLACSRNPAAPAEAPLAIGQWTGDGACLAVTESSCNLVVGCGHGQFPRPSVRSDGTFDVDGTYRIEVGPISIEPAPPAHFSGSVSGSRMTLNVAPSTGSSLSSYSIRLTGNGFCSVRCV